MRKLDMVMVGQFPMVRTQFNAKTAENFREEVRQFVVKYLDRNDLMLKRSAEIEVERKKIQSAENLRGSVMDNGDALNLTIKEAEDNILKITAKYADLLKEDSVRFKRTDAMKVLEKGYVSATSTVMRYNAIIEFFKGYGIDCSNDMTFLTLCNEKLNKSGMRSARSIYRDSEGGLSTVGVDFKAFFAMLFDLLIFKGCIKAVQMPEYSQDYYARKEAELKARKEEAKAMKKRA